MNARAPIRRRTLLGAGAAAAVSVGAGLTMAVTRHLPALWVVPSPPSRRLRPSDASPAPARQRLSVFFVGHSLVNRTMPAMARAIAAGLGVAFDYEGQWIEGGSLERHWNRPEGSTGTRAREALASGRYDTVVITEAVNLDDHLRWSDPPRHAARWFGLARARRADASLYLYETWHSRTEPRHATYLPFLPSRASWREHLDADLGKWEHIVDAAERLHAAAHPGEAPFDAHLVPGGQALAALVDAIARGEVPHVGNVDALFADHVHLSDLGNYFIALVMVATLARVDVSNAPHEVVREDGTAVRLDPATARALARIADRAVRTYPRSGVRRAPEPSAP